MPLWGNRSGPKGEPARERRGGRGRSHAERFQAAGQGARGLLVERKYITLLRADLHRSTDLVIGLELEEAIARVAPAMEAMRVAVHTHRGIIHRELGDGIFAVFGAPVADDMHGVMACLAALDLLRRIKALDDAGIGIRIGLHAGQVVAGPRQVDFSSSYEFDGLPLIVAERLQTIAEPGQALASAACRAVAEGYVRFGPAMLRPLKGFPQPVTVHAVEGVGDLSKWRVSSARVRTRFVGRAAESAQILALAEAAEIKGAGGCAAILGEAGVGKSRLAHECVDTLRARGWQVIVAECSSILGHTPFALAKAVLADIAAALGTEAMADVQKVLPAAQSAAIDVVVRGVDGANVPDWASLTPRLRGRAIVAAARAIVSHWVGDRPTIILLEDLQWADEASAATAEVILALTQQQRLVVLATARTGGLPVWLERRAARIMPLRALERDAGMAMLDQMLGSTSRLETLKQRILDHTGGMPLFVQEVCRDLVETGTLRGQWGAFDLAADAATLGVPLTLQGVIASRIDRLSRTEKRLLQAAAAVGPRVSDRLLQSVAALHEKIFGQALAALLAAALLVPAPAATMAEQGTHFFPHELIRQVAYDAVVSSERDALHGRILAALETATDAEISLEHLGALAHHAMMARHWSRAADYATAIARQCFGQAALPDAMRHYESAMKAVDRLDPSPVREARAIDLRLEARLAHANHGKVTRWLDLAREAEARAAAIGDDLRRVAALAVRAAALNFCGAPMEALEVGAHAAAEAARTGNPGWLAYAEYGLGQAGYIAGRYREAVDNFSRAQRRFTMDGATPPMGGSAVQAGLLCHMMACLCFIALGDEAAAAAEQCVADEMASQEDRPLAAIAAAFSRGALLVHQGQIQDGEKALADALVLARRHEVNLFVPIIASHQGLALLLLGRAEEAQETLDLACTEAATYEHRSAGLRATIYRAMIDMAKPDGRASALEAVQVVSRIARQQGFDPLELEAQLVEAALLGAAGDEAGRLRGDVVAEEIGLRLGAMGTLCDTRRHIAQLLKT
ncbi:AAA family ATPase [Reyranella sp. CPCC 100927]|nr:AAA family ATPase [Reyranella sp. CPCC 100927]